MRGCKMLVAFVGLSIALSPVSIAGAPGYALAQDTPPVAPLAVDVIEASALISDRTNDRLEATPRLRDKTVATQAIPPMQSARQIAEYNVGMIGGLTAQAELASARAYLGSLEVPQRSLRQIQREIDLARSDLVDLWREVARLEGELEATGGRNEWIERQLIGIQAKVQDRWKVSRQLSREFTQAQVYARALSDIAMLEDEVTRAIRAVFGLPDDPGDMDVDGIEPISSRTAPPPLNLVTETRMAE